jgi:hypothetical protein
LSEGGAYKASAVYMKGTSAYSYKQEKLRPNTHEKTKKEL